MTQPKAKARIQVLLATRDAMLKLAPALVDAREMFARFGSVELGRAISCSIETAGLREAGHEVTVMRRMTDAEAWEEAERLSRCPP